MCGRSRCTLAPAQIEKAAGRKYDKWIDQDNYNPSNNVAPGAWTPVLKEHDGDLEVHTMKWGLVPSYTKPGEKLDHWRMFNARSETVDSKPVFKKLLCKQRCVVLMNGFYEWKQEGSIKQPYYIHLKGKDVLPMAGLYDVYRDADGNLLYTYTIITVDSSSRLTWLHDRMPALLPTVDMVEAWLSGKSAGGDVCKLVQQVCVPYDQQDLSWHPVTTQLNKATHDSPEFCIDVRQKKGTISSFFKPKPAASQSKPSTNPSQSPASPCKPLSSPAQTLSKPLPPPSSSCTPSTNRASHSAEDASPDAVVCVSEGEERKEREEVHRSEGETGEMRGKKRCLGARENGHVERGEVDDGSCACVSQVTQPVEVGEAHDAQQKVLDLTADSEDEGPQRKRTRANGDAVKNSV